VETTSPFQRPKSSNAFARERDQQLAWLLERHPVTCDMLVEAGFFRTKQRARKRLRRLVERRQLRLVGTVALKDGRPQHVYSRGRSVKTDNLVHEVLITQLCFKVHADEVRRGAADVDRYLCPDAELFIDGQRFLLECDRSTLSYETVVRTRFAKYRSCTDFVLWVCTTQARMEGLRRRAVELRHTALFTTLELALRDPHAAIWLDADGQQAALPRSSGVARKGEILASS
jgi:predicted transcriptional regulator